MYHIICLNCSKEHIAKRANSKFCCDLCRSYYNRKHKRKEMECQYCKDKFKRQQFQKFCSFECSTEQKKKEKMIRLLIKTIIKIPPKINCLHCNKEFLKTTHDKVYCSKTCSAMAHKERNKKVYVRKCKECSEEYLTSDSRLMCCSKMCSNRYNWRNSYLIRRRRVNENGDFESGISAKGISKRDGDVCYLCENKVRWDVNYLDDYYPTIDHVIPISKGGTHTWDNVRLAHRLCNMYKRDNEVGNEVKQLSIL